MIFLLTGWKFVTVMSKEVSLTMRIREATIRDIIYFIELEYGIILDSNKLNKLISQSSKDSRFVKKEIKQYNNDYCFSNSFKKSILNLISLDIIKRKWPIYSENKDVYFWKDFQKRLEGNGYKLIDDNWYLNFISQKK